MKRVMLIGNPGVGKSTIFKSLTNENNSAIDVQESVCRYIPKYCLIDCPGFYSLNSGQSSNLSMQYIASELLNNPPHVILNVIDINHLEQQLLLTSQLIELGLPMAIVVTGQDQGFKPQILAKLLGVPVYNLVAFAEDNIKELVDWLDNNHPTVAHNVMPWPDSLADNLKKNSQASLLLFATRRYLESVDVFNQHASVTDDLYRKIAAINDDIVDTELEMLDERYKFIHKIAHQCLQRSQKKQQMLTSKLDKICLHRFWGWPIFLVILWVFFGLAIDLGGVVQQFLTKQAEWFFKGPIANCLNYWHAPRWLHWLFEDGVGSGFMTMLGFLPVMTLMNLFLILLESSGYMARVAYLFERFMRVLGLPGKAFLPLLIGFGCNVPAIMSARMVSGGRERLLTVILSPFMSCSARLTIYAVFASLFFPKYGAIVVLSLYLLGIVMAIFTGLILRKFWLTGQAQPMLMDLPLYKTPNYKKIMRDVYVRMKVFLIKSGALVIPFCAILGTFQAAFQYGWVLSAGYKHVLWNIWTYTIHPLFAPIGISIDNWPAAVGLITGTMAKEIVVATLNTLYLQLPVLAHSVVVPQDGNLWLKFISLPEHLANDSSRALMWAFGSSAAAYSYLLFVLLYIPCISTLAIIRQEVGRFWQWFAFVWSLILAYSIASLFYQTATYYQHHLQSILWWLANIAMWGLIIWFFQSWKPSNVKKN